MSRLSSFQKNVEEALKSFTKPEVLGEKSSLATPYFLGLAMPAEAATAVERGKVLQAILRRATNQITGKYADRWSDLIELIYFQNLNIGEASKRLQLSQSQIKNTDRKAAIVQLTHQLIELIRPALRLEYPPSRPRQKLARQVAYRRTLDLLDDGNSVFLAGVEGMGKSTMGGTIAHAWAGTTFWYTIRPGLNDHIDSLIFSLAYFCQQHGSSLLWQEIISAQGQVPREQLLEQTRYMFEQLSPPPLICIDDVDKLQMNENAEHVEMGEFIEGLQGQVPTLLMGQQQNIKTKHVEVLEPISDQAVVEMLSSQSIFLTEKEAAKVNHALGGNPQLIELAVVLIQNSGSVEVVLQEIGKTPHAKFLLERILRRLDEEQKRILMGLVVYETEAPLDAWLTGQERKEEHDAFQSLLEKKLIHFDDGGGVFLLSAYREILESILLDAISETEIQRLNQNAAEVFITRGRFTQAARHYAKSAEPEIAIWRWHEFKQQELAQGQAHAALSLFEEMRLDSLSSAARGRATDLCAELKYLRGLLDDALTDLKSVRSRPPIYEVEARQLEGIIHNDDSRFDSAKQAFSEALSMAEDLVEARLAHIHKGISWTYLQERQLDQAWEEAMLARFEADYIQGVIQFRRNNYAEAAALYLSALSLSEQANHLHGAAKVCNQLVQLYAVQGLLDEAIEYAKLSSAKFEQIGRPVGIASSNINFALSYNLAGDFTKSIDYWQKCERQFKEFGLDMPSFQQALVQQGLAEAYLGLNQLETAINHVQESMANEEIAILPDSHRTYGEILLKQGNTAEAKTWIQSSIDLLMEQERPDAHLLGYAWRAIAEVYLHEENDSMAKEAAQTALELFEQIPNQFEAMKTKMRFGWV